MQLDGLEKYKHWVFDLDGTLVDSAPDILEILHAVFLEEGLQTDGLNKYLLGPVLVDILRAVCPHLSEDKLMHVLNVYRGRYRQCAFAKSLAYAGIVPLFDFLLHRGCSLYVATNKPHDVTHALLGARGFLPLLKGIACSDSIEGRVLSKAQMLQHLMQTYHFQAQEAVMVGDSVFDIRGGKEAGLATVGALYGYGDKDTLLAEQPNVAVLDAAWTKLTVIH